MLARFSPLFLPGCLSGPGLLTLSKLTNEKHPVLPAGVLQGKEQLLAFHPQHPVITDHLCPSDGPMALRLRTLETGRPGNPRALKQEATLLSSHISPPFYSPHILSR